MTASQHTWMSIISLASPDSLLYFSPLNCLEKYFIWLIINCFSAMNVLTTSFSWLTILIAMSCFYFYSRSVDVLAVDDPGFFSGTLLLLKIAWFFRRFMEFGAGSLAPAESTCVELSLGFVCSSKFILLPLIWHVYSWWLYIWLLWTYWLDDLLVRLIGLVDFATVWAAYC